MDFMKKTNDLYGHDMGDSAIKEIASIILKVISKEDIAIRYGGDEFVIITNYSSKDLSTKITDEVFSFSSKRNNSLKDNISIYSLDIPLFVNIHNLHI